MNNIYIDLLIIILGIDRYHTYLFIFIIIRESIELTMKDFKVMKSMLNLGYKK